MSKLGRLGGTDERPAIFFDTAVLWRSWLAANHQSEREIWLGLYKKHVPDRGLTWEQAVPEALCYGWIDSQAQRLDADAVRQRWTPRKAGSTWSRVNVAHVERLIAAGQMMPAGLAAYERRRANRTGIYAYEVAAGVLLPNYEQALQSDPIASAWWNAAPAGYRRICTKWVLSAKAQATRDKRMATLIEDSKRGLLIPSQRYGAEPGWATKARAALRIDPSG
ncbi:MAG: YdeI/OmpD-associated family protein [Antricoccus sp.]